MSENLTFEKSDGTKKNSELNLKKIPESIGIMLDTYDDIFSDFDSRDFTYRNISDDFIEEIKKLSSEHEFQISEVKLILPAKVRKIETEQIISARLHAFFKVNFTKLKDKKKEKIRNGFYLLLLGFSLLFVAGILGKFQTSNIYERIIFVLTEPSGWYFSWTGFEKLFTRREDIKIIFSAFEKLSRSKIIFYSAIAI